MRSRTGGGDAVSAPRGGTGRARSRSAEAIRRSCAIGSGTKSAVLAEVRRRVGSQRPAQRPRGRTEVPVCWQAIFT